MMTIPKPGRSVATIAAAAGGLLVWVIIALVMLVLSLLGPLGAATAGAGVTLAAMHLVVGTTLIFGLGGTLTSERQTR